MPFYRYTAVAADGSVVRNVMEADDLEAVYRAAERKRLNVVSVGETSALLSRIRRRLGARRIRRMEVIEFSKNLSVMLKAGLPLLSSLEDIAGTTENRDFRKVILSIHEQVAMGASLSEAVRMHGLVFPEIFVRLIAVGEHSGNLEGSLADIAGHLRKMEELSAAIRRALIYPVFALVTALGALLFWLVYVLPKLLDTFNDLGVPIPPVTRALIAASGFTRTHWQGMLLAPPLVFALLRLLRLHPLGALWLDRAKLRLPIVRLILENKILGLFAEQMRILIRAGVTVDQAFGLTADVLGNRVYADAVGRVRGEVLAGSTIAEAVRKQGVFPPLVLRMLHIGETSGSLDEQFRFLAEHHMEKLDDVSQKLGKMLEPIIVGFLGIVFAVIIVGLLLPVYDMVSKI